MDGNTQPMLLSQAGLTTPRPSNNRLYANVPQGMFTATPSGFLSPLADMPPSFNLLDNLVPQDGPVQPIEAPPTAPSPRSRTLICCFDGTGNKFGEENSNVVRLFSALEKNKPDEQIVYYQPGIGTYAKAQYVTKTWSWVHSTVDQAVALDLNNHVKEGYQFIMQNYRPGDKICLFGFSRGAYTARVVMGMIYKIGILPKDNIQQIDFAFSVYQMQGEEGRDLSREFKRTFALPVTVEFVGVWDTVSSVGVIPRAHPYTSVNYATKYFRHALALDECRARFRPKTWYEATLEREQELDVDEPEYCEPPSGCRDDWEYKAPSRTIADVEEVWFSGCHADVGGGSHHNRFRDSLSYIPLRWMIKEVIVAKVGLLFNPNHLRELGFDFIALAKEIRALGLHPKDFNLGWNWVSEEGVQGSTTPPNNNASPSPESTVLSTPGQSPPQHTTPFPPFRMNSPDAMSHNTGTLSSSIAKTPASPRKLTPAGEDLRKTNPAISLPFLHPKDDTDHAAKVYDQLWIQRGWWALEIIPMLTTMQTPEGNWQRQRLRNFGHGRYLPYHEGRVEVHETVKYRMKMDTPEAKMDWLEEDKMGQLGEEEIDRLLKSHKGYIPAASNWAALMKAGMIKWVT